MFGRDVASMKPTQVWFHRKLSLSIYSLLIVQLRAQNMYTLTKLVLTVLFQSSSSKTAALLQTISSLPQQERTFKNVSVEEDNIFLFRDQVQPSGWRII